MRGRFGSILNNTNNQELSFKCGLIGIHGIAGEIVQEVPVNYNKN